MGLSKRDKNGGRKGHVYSCGSSFLILIKLCRPEAEGYHRNTMSSLAIRQSHSFSSLQISTQPTFLTWKVKFIFSVMHVSGSWSSFDPYTSEVGFINLIETKFSVFFIITVSFIYLWSWSIYGMCTRCQTVLGTRRPIFIRQMAPLKICTIHSNLVNGLFFFWWGVINSLSLQFGL